MISSFIYSFPELMTDEMDILAYRFKTAREARNWSLRKVETLSDVDLSTLFKIEKQRFNLTDKNKHVIADLSRVFDLPTEYFTTPPEMPINNPVLSVLLYKGLIDKETAERCDKALFLAE